MSCHTPRPRPRRGIGGARPRRVRWVEPRRSSSTTPAGSAAGANPVQRENSRPGSPGLEIPAGAGTVITGYASESASPRGKTFTCTWPRRRICGIGCWCPAGWYRGVGGRLIPCAPRCRSSRAAIAGPARTAPDPVSGPVPRSLAGDRAVSRSRPALPPATTRPSSRYTARGANAGAVGSVPLIVRQSPVAPGSAMLVQVPVNTWEAYNAWGSESLFRFGAGEHALKVSFDRPLDQQQFGDVVMKL